MSIYGYAQKLFFENYPSKGYNQLSEWPFLEKLVAKGLLDFIDIALADGLLMNEPHRLECIAALICYLSLAARSGHICSKIDSDSLCPNPLDIALNLQEQIQTTN